MHRRVGPRNRLSHGTGSGLARTPIDPVAESPEALMKDHRCAARRAVTVATLAAAMTILATSLPGQQPSSQPLATQEDGFRFKSGVELINIAATVSDSSGRFVSGLRQEDFLVYEDDQLQTVTHFSSERVPVSLGIALDTSASMAGNKIANAQSALNRFLGDLLGAEDEIFLYRFSNGPIRLEGWTSDRRAVARALGRIIPSGGTAMYDTIAEAIPLAQNGRHWKKALVIISDGNDTTSRVGASVVRQLIRESEVMVYAIGIDGGDEPWLDRVPPPRPPTPVPIPRPPRGPVRGGWPLPPPRAGQQGIPWHGGDDRVNVYALREMTDDSGGRTEIIRRSSDLDPATASIADELSKQYYLGYPTSGKRDGRWHSIRVEVRNRTCRVRARRGYIAS
jgi:Ca-activated chloride channel homolog